MESAGEIEMIEPRVVVGDPKWQYASQISPDGGLMAYVSRETGRDEIYMRLQLRKRDEEIESIKQSLRAKFTIQTDLSKLSDR